MGEILVVDDDPSGLKFFSLSLEKVQYSVVTAADAKAAKKAVMQRGVDSFDCVLTDYRMPGENGIDLLNWLQEEDPCLATIIVTAEGEMNLVQDSMRGGAVDFLEKPVSRRILEEAVSKGIEHTLKQRALESNDQSVRAVSQMNQIFEAVRAPALEERLSYFSIPHHEIGGDFINVLPIGEQRYAFILGDVSGHDIRAAFVSAYFQGMVRGLLEKNTGIEEIVPLFNVLLNQEWSSLTGYKKSGNVPIMTSLSVCAAVIDMDERKLTMLNCGIPEPVVLRKDGRVHRCGEGNPPLGWFSYWDFEREVVSLDDLLFLYVCTDGLQEYASKLSVSPLCIIYKLLETGKEDGSVTVSDAGDDILVMRFQIDPNFELKDLPQPIIYEQYAGDESSSIDKFQNVWRRSIQFVLPPAYDERLYDMLLCCREVLLNALEHGCEGSSEKNATLSVTYSNELGLLRFRIDDPGHGHSFDIDKRIDEISDFRGEQLGLTIVSQLSDSCAIQNDGSTVIFDFKVSDSTGSEPAEQTN